MREIESQQSINQRINFLIDHFERGNKSAFGRRVDMRSGVVGDLVGGRLNKPSYEAIVKILSAYPSISTDWLILGRGPMIRDDAQEATVETQPTQLNELIKQAVTSEIIRYRLEKLPVDIDSSVSSISRELVLVRESLDKLKEEEAKVKQSYKSEMIEKELSRISADKHKLRNELKGLIEIRDKAIGDRELLINETKSVLYKVTGLPESSKPFGGLLPYRLGISEQAAIQLITAKKLRAVEIEGEGYRVSELAVREFLGEA
jgi:hypothetical protein